MAAIENGRSMLSVITSIVRICNLVSLLNIYKFLNIKLPREGGVFFVETISRQNISQELKQKIKKAQFFSGLCLLRMRNVWSGCTEVQISNPKVFVLILPPPSSRTLFEKKKRKNLLPEIFFVPIKANLFEQQCFHPILF